MLIVLLSDFGLSDSYVGVMKGVMAGVAPNIHQVDLTHEVPAFDVVSGSYLLYSAWNYFPKGSVFLAVVDPGVGTARRELVASSGGKVLIAPDNGIVSLVKRMNPDTRCYRARQDLLSEIRLAKPPWANTFDGRDVFAPLAALAGAEGLVRVRGTQISDPVLTDRVSCSVDAESERLTGTVIHIDHFGNCISSIHYDDARRLFGENGHTDISLRISAGGSVTLPGVRSTYSEVEQGEPVAYWGSVGFLEIAVRNGHAASMLGIQRSDRVGVTRAPRG
ncbi:MAG: S-adenosyl-l-methionine hydroxide adenosyltransferase family protein [Spirochaetaceae bacterium]